MLGSGYFPVQTLVIWIGRKIDKNGHRVRRAIRDLINAGLVISHKGGNSVSMNTGRRVEIFAFIDANLT